jgi:hypothetical protein
MAADERQAESRSPAMKTLVAYGRGAAGALLVGLHLIFTMEMWWAAYYVPAWKILLLLAVNAGILLILQHSAGCTTRKHQPRSVIP